MGITLPHEHLFVQGWHYKELNYFNSTFMELEQYKAAGGKTIVDLTNIGRERDPAFVKRLAHKSGIHVIMGTGFYKEAWLPPEILTMSSDQITRTIIKEIDEGIDDTAICAGIIGEIGISSQITAVEERILVATANAQQATGAAIVLHFEIGAQGAEYHHVLDILEAKGIDLDRVAISHLVPRPDNFELIKELTDRGCYASFDLFGQEKWPLADSLINTHPEVQVSTIKGLVDFGMLERILISQNVCHILHFTVNGGMGYAHILKNVVPRFKEYGITDQEIGTMMVENPSKLMAFRS
jgi:phosphotriesterase-related protein